MRVPLESLNTPESLEIRFRPRVLQKTFGPLIQPRSISVLHGDERAPLSILAHTVAVSVAKSNHDARSIFLDSGSNYSPSLVRRLSSDPEVLERILVGSVMGLLDVVEMLDNLDQLSDVLVIILDSLTGSLNLTGAPGTRGRQRELFHTLEKLRETANKINSHVLITDHSSKNWNTGEYSPIGGNVLAHAVDNVVRIVRLQEGVNLIRIQVERWIAPEKPPGIIVKADSRGIRLMR